MSKFHFVVRGIATTLTIGISCWATSDRTFAETPAAPAASIDFTRDVQPILANHCWNCHGPDEESRQADLRLDLRDEAVSGGAVVPSDAKASPLVARIDSTDPDEVMPPPDAKKPLTPAQRETLRRWIDQGANFASHWAFITPAKLPPPDVDLPTEGVTWIDRFIAQKLAREGMHLSPQADRGTLLRRVTLDLTGLPPTPQELDAFLHDPSPQAYEKAVDRLLASQAYAEKMAAQWLDLARYADTNGYNNDEDRTMWPWRDWVIHAFDDNMPYDRFLTEQLAGDLLPEPSRSQLVATAFLRNQGHNTEGGIIAEEYRVEYVADRVHTTATVFLGLSMQCARCHDHKYDPISMQEYYRFFALFNNLDEKQASYSKFVAAEPFLRVPSDAEEAELTRLDDQIADLKRRIEQLESQAPQTFATWAASQADAALIAKIGQSPKHHLPLDRPEAIPTDADNRWPAIDSLHPERSATVVGKIAWAEGHDAQGQGTPGQATQGQSAQFDGQTHLAFDGLNAQDGSSPFSISLWIRPETGGGMAILSKMDEGANYRGYDLLIDNGKVTMHLIHRWPDNAVKVTSQEALAADQWHHVAVSYDGSRKAAGVTFYFDGKPVKTETNADSLNDTAATDQPFRLGLREKSLPFRGRIDDVWLFEGTLQAEQVAQLREGKPLTSVVDWARRPFAELPADRQAFVKAFALRELDPDHRTLVADRDAAQKRRDELANTIPAVMVMKEMQPPRETFVLKRGQYDQPSDKVSPGVPAALRAFDPAASAEPQVTGASAEPGDRAALAKWLVDPNHPLTARVAVNRFWEIFFGTGLVKTVEDFGVTGEFPSHPELLDQLAIRFVDSGWDVKELLKSIAMSATYRQDSKVDPDRYARDPENRLLGRGPRYRLPAETIRDNALAISGLLSRRVGGPSVKPYQPEGLWEDVTVERRGKYVPDSGEGLYRRGIYTFWKRTCPPPSMVSFDAPNREVCVARRSRTNTPLQSLVLMNDPTYVEAARELAKRLLLDHADDDARVDAAYRRCVARSPRAEESQIIRDLLARSRDRYATAPEQAAALIAVGSTAADPKLDPKELAAWTIVTSTLLNLDETISKR
jgi:mono/diheme cytochrome c family protein